MPTVRVTALLATVLFAAGVLSTLPPRGAAALGDGDEVSIRLLPPQVSAGEPATILARLDPPQAGVAVEAQQQDPDGTWAPAAGASPATTDRRGRALIRLDTSAAADGVGEQEVAAHTFRAVAGDLVSRPAVLEVNPRTNCRPDTPLVDREATGEAVCLAARLDNWRRAGLTGVGQQVNASSLDWRAPLDALEHPVSLVGFDLEELAQAFDYEFPFGEQVLDDLLARSAAGAVLVASWHARNPVTGGPFTDRSWTDLSKLLDETSRAGRAFWADFEAKMALVARFQDGNAGAHPRTALVLRPLHEPNGAFSWWGKPSRAVYLALWDRMQERAADLGVHNIVWAYSFNRRTEGVSDPSRLVPRRVDLAGIDTYDPERPPAGVSAEERRRIRADRLGLEGYAEVAALPVDRVPRLALTEVGPHAGDATWRPAAVTAAIRRELGSRRRHPVWAMFWFDDRGYPQAGTKQIASFETGQQWLAGCPAGFCLRP